MSAETLAAISSTALLIYVCCGIVFMIAFLFNGISKVDAATHGSKWGFKIIIIPGVIALWPLLLQKWIKARKNILNQSSKQ